MSRLIICRHGNTFDKGDVVTRVGGRTDLPLSRSGQAQALRLAADFKSDGLRFDRAYTSALRRTRETANAIIADTKDVQIETLSFLAELDYGPDENQPEAQVVARIGQEALTAWDEQAILPDGWQLDVEDTIQAWMDFLHAQQGLDGVGLVVTSNGIARFLPEALKRSGGRMACEVESLKLRTAAFADLQADHGGWVLRRWNCRPAE
jgi:probable phosphoglycerate mutase